MQAAAAAPADTNTDCEAELVSFCDAVHSRSLPAIARARAALLSAFGGDEAKLVDAAAVIAFFNGLADRIADATGLRVEEARLKTSMKYASEAVLTSSSSPVTQGLVSMPRGSLAKL